MPVYKRSVFRQSSPKLDLVSNTTVVNPFIAPLPVYPVPSESSLATLEKLYLFDNSPPEDLLVQVVLSRPVAALTASSITSYWSTNLGLPTEQTHYLGDPTMKDQTKSTKMSLYGWTNISVISTLRSAYLTWIA